MEKDFTFQDVGDTKHIYIILTATHSASSQNFGESE
jgi:hypothetical protein